MAIFKKVLILISLGFLVLTPFSAGAIQLEAVGDSSNWSEVEFEFRGTDKSSLAGEFDLILGLGSDAFDTVGYCVELDEMISFETSYDVVLKPVTFKENGLDAAWLMNEYAYGLGNRPNDPAINEMDAKAALQLAIWDTIYGDQFTVLNTTSDTIENLYTVYISGLSLAKSDGDYNTGFADNFSITHIDDVQDLLIYNPDASGAVPEPATILLMGCGLISLGLIRKKSNKRKSGAATKIA